MQFSENSTRFMKHIIGEFSKSIDKSVNKKNKHVQKETDGYLSNFYDEMVECYKTLQRIKKDKRFFSSKLTKIKIPEQIPKSHLFESEFVSHSIKKYIEQHAIYDLCYIFTVDKKLYKVHFVLLDENETLKLDKYELYIEKIIMWIALTKKYNTVPCNKDSISIYFYLTPFKKKFPECSITVIGPEQVNSGVAYVCADNGEIMVYREEEWFKVFIHETFHSFGLDFSKMDQRGFNKKILALFPVNTEVNLFEAYTECWARIFNSLFISFYTLKDIKNKEEFMLSSEFCLQFEGEFSVFQMNKVLHCMGLNYHQLYSSSRESEIARSMLYKEKSNVFAYYIITSILLSNYPLFMSWSYCNNLNFIEFTNTLSNLNNFYELIKKTYLSKKYLSYVDNYEYFLHSLISDINASGGKKIKPEEIEEKMELFNTARMTICEI